MTEAEIRAALTATLSGVVIPELGILAGAARADVVSVTDDAMHGVEIKSAQDSLARLSGQVAAYSRVFDRATLVCAPHFLQRAWARIPAWWGLSVADAGAIVVERDAQPNPTVDETAAVQLLWADDALALLDARGAARGLRGKPRTRLWARVCEVYTLDEIRAEVRRRVVERHRACASARGRTSPIARP